MDYEDRPRRRGRGLTLFSIVLVLAVLGAMIAVIVYPGEEAEAPAQGTTQPQTATPTPLLTTPDPQMGEAVDLRSNPFVQIAQEAGPSVVSVSNKIRWFVGQDGALGDLVQSSGSGVVLSQDGYIVTNQHVIEGAEIVTVTMSDGEEYSAQVIGQDATSDLAVIKVEKTGLIPARIGASRDAQVGEFVVAIGSPLGDQLFGSVTLGILSAKERLLDVSDSNRIELLQTDAAINPGNSGGALYNIRGELIGINTIKYSYTGAGISTEGLGFAIPIDNAIPIIEELIQSGKVVRPVLGIQLTMIDEASAQQMGVPAGALVREVFAGSPAQAAGIQPMDVITQIDGVRIEVFADLTSTLNGKQFDEEAVLSVYRDGKMIEVRALLFAYQNPED